MVPRDTKNIEAELGDAPHQYHCVNPDFHSMPAELVVGTGDCDRTLSTI